MFIWFVIIFIAVISFLWSLLSLRSLDKGIEIKDIKKKLLLGKVVYQDSSTTISSSESER